MRELDEPMTDDERKRPLHPLEPALQATLKTVGPQNYARVTAREFAKGGKYNPTTRPTRFAKS